MENTHQLRRSWYFLLLPFLIFMGCSSKPDLNTINLAKVAIINNTRGEVSGERADALRDGIIPEEVGWNDSYVGWTRDSSTYVQYDWSKPVSINKVVLSWWENEDRYKLPESMQLQYLTGDGSYVEVPNASAYTVTIRTADTLSFDAIETTSLRLVMVPQVAMAEDDDNPGEMRERRYILGLLEWAVIPSKYFPYPPVVTAGGDRSVMPDGKTYLMGSAVSLSDPERIEWKKVSGPGAVNFADDNAFKTTATFGAKGTYTLSLVVTDDNQTSESTLNVTVTDPPEAERLEVVYTKDFKIDNPLWNNRSKALITEWIPHCIRQIERTDLERGQGGLDNFINAAKAMRGEEFEPHKGYVFSNAWVHQTIESMAIALMVDPNGDREIMAAQKSFRKTIDKWIPIILSAQEPDGYLQTAYTARDPESRWQERWDPDRKSTHEGYVGGYFIESAINHYTLTNGEDTRLYDAAKKLADCWVKNIGSGPDQQPWYDGHQEMEQALVRFGRFVNDMEGNGAGDDYIALSKFLLDNRGGGSEYDQSHVPVQQQYEAVGHAVRATYSYSGMADIAAETGDTDYQSAVRSLWDNMVNKKYYVTGGIGSGETSEGFGPNYSLRNNSYCESCSTCGLIFFQYKMNLAYHDAKYADLYEESMFNALLGSLDMPGKNFFYTNPLASDNERDPWHACPCCVGNIPRTLLMVPTWSYVKDANGIYVNLFNGSTVNVEEIAGTNVQLVQKTDYPWKGEVSLTVNPAAETEFTMHIRVPDRNTSELYTSTPAVSGLEYLKVNGEDVVVNPVNGYANITRTWKAGDKIEFGIPMKVQRIKADERIEADRGRVALRYGPLIYNVEEVDQDVTKVLSDKPVVAEWREDLFGGVMVLTGEWEDGTPMLAIPNYTRLNRELNGNDGPESIVWMKDKTSATTSGSN